MRGKLNGARRVVVDSLDATPFLSAWAFELTPPSSAATDDTYLRHVREADFVIWIAGAEVSGPVTNEVREALVSDRRLIIVRYGSAPRGAACQALLEEVGLAAKYADARDDDELALAVELAMGDEIVRALRGEPGLGRLARIEELGRASHARCVVRWRAAGLPRALAAELASRPDVGAPLPEIVPTPEKPVVLLTGELGAGKSICAERHHQSVIAALLRGDSGVLPVWLRASDVAGDLRRAVNEACAELGRPAVQGAAVIVDGLDEAGFDVAEELVMEARELAENWSHTTVLLTSRPGTYVALSEERTEMPVLTAEESWAIAALAAGESVRQAVFWGLPEAVKESARRPLFALLVGLWHRDARDKGPRTQADLLAFLGERAVKTTGEDASSLLAKLAVASVRREFGPVPTRELGRSRQLRELRESGLVTEKSGGIAFGLPVLAQWFAAQALLDGVVDTAALSEAPEDIDLWLYPLAIAVATGTYEDSVRLLTPLAERIPGFAYRVIGTSLGGLGPGGSAGSWRTAGARIRESLGSLVGALLPLGSRALPVHDDGRVLPLAVASDDDHVTTAFWDARVLLDPGVPKPDLFELPDDFDFLGADWEWRGVRAAIPGPGSAWPWRWARDVIKHDLGHAVKDRRLPVGDAGPLAVEEEWEAVVDFTRSVPLTAERIPIAPILAELEARIDELEQDAARWGVPVRSSTFCNPGGRDHDQYWLRDRLVAARTRGVNELPRPLPGPDRLESGGGALDAAFSDEQLIEYTTLLYGAAIEAFECLVRTQLPRLGNRMALATTLPATFVGTLIRGRGDTFGMTTLSGYFAPLPVGSGSDVRITVGDAAHERHRAADAFGQVRALRPDAARWITAWSGGSWLNPGSRYAVTKVVTAWLWRDLQHIGVVEGMLPADNL